MSKHFCKFDENGKIIASYLNDGMPYTEDDLLEMGCIEVSEEDFILYMENGGNKYIRGKEGSPVIQDGFEEGLKEYWEEALKSQYDAERVRLGTLLLMADDVDEETEIKAQKEKLTTKYKSDLAKVEQGINPFE